MADPWPSSTPRDELLARVATSGRRRLRLRRLGALVGAAGLITSAVVGLGVGRSGGLDLVDEPATVGGQADATAPFSACPGDPPIGELHRGDRVFLTGRDVDAAWLELRSPANAADRVWVQAPAVGADDAVDGLPVHDCSTEGNQLALQGGTTTTLPTTTTAASTPSTTSTTHPPATTAPTTTQPPDTTPPSVTELNADVNTIATRGGQCPPYPKSTPVDALVADASGIAAVELGWSFPGANGTVAGTTQMTLSTGRYRAVFGPFTPGTLPQGGSVSVAWTVRAVDAAGNERQVAAGTAELITVKDNC